MSNIHWRMRSANGDLDARLVPWSAFWLIDQASGRVLAIGPEVQQKVGAMKPQIWLVLFAALALSACIYPPTPRDEPLTEKLPPLAQAETGNGDALFAKRYDFEAWVAAHKYRLPKHAVIVSMSGGGTRAAALAQSVILGLNQYRLSDGHTLADNIITVSAVSGGALTAAAYAVDGIQGLGSTFQSNVLQASLMDTVLFHGVLNPFAWPDRAKPFQDKLDETFLTGRSYADLAERREAPFLFINSTDIVSGRQFTFTQQQAADLCADLRRMKLSAAVTAAGNFPFASTDIELKNFQNGSDACLDPSPGDVFASETFPYTDLNGATEARYRDQIRSARPGNEPASVTRPIEWLHLFDGGLADNLGIRPIIRTLTPEMLAKLAGYGVEDITLIQINARSDTVQPRNTESGSPILLPNFLFTQSDSTMLVATSYGPIDRITSLSATFANERLDVIFANQAPNTSKFPKTLYPVVIDFDELADSALREKVKSIQTQTALNDENLRLVQNVGRTLLAENPCLRAFVDDARKQGETVSYDPSELDGRLGNADVDKVARGESCNAPLVPGKLSLKPVRFPAIQLK
jgi:NTE family protein